MPDAKVELEVHAGYRRGYDWPEIRRWSLKVTQVVGALTLSRQYAVPVED